MPKGGNMNKILLTGSVVLGLATAGLLIAPSFANAQSGNSNGNGYGYEQALESKAKILNMTTEQLRTQLETKTMLQVAEDNGLTESQWQTQLQTAAQERWQDRGLTQAEIDSRLQTMKERQANCDGDGSGAQLGAGNGNGMHRNNQ